MKRKKGQALVEFVIILPIFIFMLLAIIDVGKIIYFQNLLESEMSSVIDLYKNKKTLLEIQEMISLNDDETIFEIENENNEFLTFYLKKNVTLVTPGLSAVFDNPNIIIKRVMKYE